MVEGLIEESRKGTFGHEQKECEFTGHAWTHRGQAGRRRPWCAILENDNLGFGERFGCQIQGL